MLTVQNSVRLSFSNPAKSGGIFYFYLMKRRCIICTETKPEQDFNEEHIIPASLGGVIVIYTVCKGCNSDFGKNIDTPLLKHELMLYYRNIFNITRDEGRRKEFIPNPFKKPVADSQGRLYKVGFKNNKLYSEPLEQIKVGEYVPEKGGFRVDVILPKEKEDQAEDFIRKVLERKGLSFTSEDLKKAEKKVFQNEPLQPNLYAKNNDLIFGCIKIAYEACVTIFPYLESDPVCELLRKTIKTKTFNHKVRKLLEKHTEFSQIFREHFKKVPNLQPYHHCILITHLKGYGLVCGIRLFEVVYPIIISKTINPLPKDGVLFVYNDAIEKTFATNVFEDYPNINLTIDFNGVSDEVKEKIISNGQSYFEDDKSRIPVFNSKMELAYKDLNELCIVKMKTTQKSIPWFVPSVEFDLEKEDFWVNTKCNTPVRLLKINPIREAKVQPIY